MSQSNQTTLETENRELLSSRLIKASPEKVFEALQNPDILARWWGPDGFTNTFQTFDFRPDGTWEFMMHGPDGANYPNKSVFVDIVETERVVFDHVVAPNFRMTITLDKTDKPNETRFAFHMLFESAQLCQQLKSLCIPANEQNFDRLEAVLADL
jgi:uncharacterized protein YndB with AHSA1/START domain